MIFFRRGINIICYETLKIWEQNQLIEVQSVESKKRIILKVYEQIDVAPIIIKLALLTLTLPFKYQLICQTLWKNGCAFQAAKIILSPPRILLNYIFCLLIITATEVESEI